MLNHSKGCVEVPHWQGLFHLTTVLLGISIGRKCTWYCTFSVGMSTTTSNAMTLYDYTFPNGYATSSD